jgi:hypothetical protein
MTANPRIYDGDSHHATLDVANLSGDITITTPAVTSTLAILGANTFTAAQDFGDNDLTSVDKIEGVDADVYIDLGADGIVEIASDTSLDLKVGDDGLRLTDGTDQVIINTGDGLGVTSISFSALNLVTTGTISGAIATEKDDNSLAAAQCYGTFHWYSGGAETTTLPAAVVGMNFCAYSSDASVKKLDPNETDTIVLNGTALAAGYMIKSPGAVGDFICLACFTANQWTTLGQSGVWVTNGE